MLLMGMKNPLVKPATLEMMGDKRKALMGKAQMRAMSRAVQVWLRARLITITTCPNTSKLYNYYNVYPPHPLAGVFG